MTDNLHSGELVCGPQNVSIANLVVQERRGCSAAMMEQVSPGTRREIAPVSNVQLHRDVKFGDAESADRHRCRDCASDVVCVRTMPMNLQQESRLAHKLVPSEAASEPAWARVTNQTILDMR